MKKEEMNIGQLFIVGYSGETPPRVFLNFLAEEHIGGVILFADNCPTHEQAAVNIATLRTALGPTSPFIAVDQEGGRVCRLKGAPAEYGSAWSYGRSQNLERYREQYSRAAVYLESIGFNLNFAPVCDILLNPENKCLADRCFGQSPEAVDPFVVATVEVSRRSGLLSCLKHFPGLGAADTDPHKGVPSVSFDQISWQQQERKPFAAGIEHGADMVMTTHVILPEIDDTIVTGSPKVVNSLLRQNLAYDGVVITDDLLMDGAKVLGGYGERAVKAFLAGHDLLLFSQDYEATAQAYDYFCEAFRRGEIDPALVRTALDRVAGIKFKMSSSVLP